MDNFDNPSHELDHNFNNHFSNYDDLNNFNTNNHQIIDLNSNEIPHHEHINDIFSNNDNMNHFTPKNNDLTNINNDLDHKESSNINQIVEEVNNVIEITKEIKDNFNRAKLVCDCLKNCKCLWNQSFRQICMPYVIVIMCLISYGVYFLTYYESNYEYSNNLAFISAIVSLSISLYIGVLLQLINMLCKLTDGCRCFHFICDIFNCNNCKPAKLSYDNINNTLNFLAPYGCTVCQWLNSGGVAYSYGVWSIFNFLIAFIVTFLAIWKPLRKIDNKIDNN